MRHRRLTGAPAHSGLLTLISIGATFVPHLPVTAALALTAIDLGVLIYFIHHTATAIQLPEVIASVARDLARASDAEKALSSGDTCLVNGPSADVLQARLDRAGSIVTAPASGYLLYVRHATLVRIAAECDAVIRLHYRPGHFLAPQLRSQVLLDQAAMIQRASRRTVPEPADQADITARYEALLALSAQSARAQPEPR
jgi:uncharacterized membrane protein